MIYIMDEGIHKLRGDYFSERNVLRVYSFGMSARMKRGVMKHEAGRTIMRSAGLTPFQS